MCNIKFRPLRADEIECRVAQVKSTGVQLLLYKNARADMNVLDETVGCMNWKREHTRDNANCIVSIWDDDKKQWVGKEDTGAESYTEKEKGLCSDSFKRSCVNWGIGRQLYTSPFIWINANNVEINGTKCYERFSVSSITVDSGNIVSLEIANSKGVKVFSWKDKGFVPKCEVCGKELEEETIGTKVWSPEALSQASVKKYGKCLCKECRTGGKK